MNAFIWKWPCLSLRQVLGEHSLFLYLSLTGLWLQRYPCLDRLWLTGNVITDR